VEDEGAVRQNSTCWYDRGDVEVGIHVRIYIYIFCHREREVCVDCVVFFCFFCF
jgi:hypothetical protein